MTASPWDDPDLADAGDFYEFNNIGDVASGCIKAVRTHRFPETGNVAAQVLMVDDDGTDKCLTAGQFRLKKTLVEQRPMPGDHLRVTYVASIPLAGGKAAKDFTVQITRGHNPALAAAAAQVSYAAPAPVAAYAPPAPVAAPVAAYAPPVAPVPAPVAPVAYAPPAAPVAAAPVAAPPVPGLPLDPAAAQAAMNALTPEQRAQMGLPPA